MYFMPFYIKHKLYIVFYVYYIFNFLVKFKVQNYLLYFQLFIKIL